TDEDVIGRPDAVPAEPGTSAPAEPETQDHPPILPPARRTQAAVLDAASSHRLIARAPLVQNAPRPAPPEDEADEAAEEAPEPSASWSADEPEAADAGKQTDQPADEEADRAERVSSLEQEMARLLGEIAGKNPR